MAFAVRMRAGSSWSLPLIASYQLDRLRPLLLLLGDLPEQIAHAVRVAVVEAEHALHVALGGAVVLELEREQADGVDRRPDFADWRSPRPRTACAPPAGACRAPARGRSSGAPRARSGSSRRRRRGSSPPRRETSSAAPAPRSIAASSQSGRSASAWRAATRCAAASSPAMAAACADGEVRLRQLRMLRGKVADHAQVGRPCPGCWRAGGSAA